MRAIEHMDQPATQSDLQSLKDDLQSLEERVDMNSRAHLQYLEARITQLEAYIKMVAGQAR